MPAPARLPVGTPLGSKAGPAPSPVPSYAFPPPRRRSRLRLVLVVIVVIVVLFVVFAAIGAVVYDSMPPPNVDVEGINVYAPDNVCGLHANPISYLGFNASARGQVALDLQLENFNSTACAVEAVTTNTSGFSVSGVHVSGIVGPFGNGTISLTLSLPGSAYSGIVNLVFS